MASPNPVMDELVQLADHDRHPQALSLFCKEVQAKTFGQCSGSEMALLDVICQRILPQLLEHHVLWLINHTDLVHRMLALLTGALQARYCPAATLDQIAWLRCLAAISAARAGHIQQVHEELCLVANEEATADLPPPNGQFNQQIEQIEAAQKTSAYYLQHFFDSYLEFLHRVKQHELANHLQSRLGILLGCLARDEKRPGVVRALFYDQKQTGHTGFVHVKTGRISPDQADASGQDPICYAQADRDVLDTAMREAAHCAYRSVDAYLKRNGYPDGLTERSVRWEIANLYGDTLSELDCRFFGGSAALPLAVAILSEYLHQPVPNDVALTGAILPAGANPGHIQPVDGIDKKVREAVLAGARIIYLPAANYPELTTQPALNHLITEHGARIVPVESIDRVGQKLFPPEGSGRLRDVVKDAAVSFVQIFQRKKPLVEQKFGQPPHIRHQNHIRICMLLTAALVFLEGWRLYKAFTPEYPALEAWLRIITATVVVFISMAAAFALPPACLRHRKSWSWYAGIKLIGIGTALATILIGSILPDFTDISRLFNAPPTVGLMKDMFVIWIFAWVIAANTYTATAGLEWLIARRQFVTARTCLKWDSPLEARMPLRCIHFDWKWGGLVIAVITFGLIGSELYYYSTLRTGTESFYWEMLLGLGRDLVFLVAIVEVMLFYKNAVAEIRRHLT